jgi:DNA-binding CsgD family transcriptional regulator
VIGPRRATLTGRGAELAALAQAADSARDGRGGMVLVSGEAGVGKSRLCREFVATIGVGIDLLGQAYPGDRVVDNAILVDTLRNSRRDAAGRLWPAARRRATLLGTVVPELLDASGGTAAIHDETQIFEAVLDVVEEAAGDRVAIWVAEDVQWADPASWRFLHYCVRRAPSMRLLMVATFRDDEKLPEDSDWTRFTVLASRDGLARLQLPRLSRDDTERIARELCGDEGDAVVAEIVERSGGTPLLVEELAGMHGAVGGQPSGVPEVIRATARERSRIAGESARTLLQLAAVMGHDADLDLLVDLRPDQGTAVEPLVAAGLLRPLTEAGSVATIEFRHPLLREAVYEDIPWEQRRRLHAEAAEALTEHTSVQSVERVAQHWERAGRPDAALECLVRVGGQARQQGNLHRAISLGWLAFHLVERHRRLGDQRAAALESLLGDLVDQGRWEEAQPLLLPAWEQAAPGSRARTHLTALRALTGWFLGNPPAPLLQMLDREAATLAGAETREAALLYVVSGLIAHATGDVERSHELLDHGRRAAVACGDLDIEARAIIHRAWLRVLDVRQAGETIAELRDLAGRLGAAGLHARQASILLQVARATLDEADMARAEDFGDVWNPWMAMGARVLRAHVAVFSGRYATVGPVLDEVAARVDERSQAAWSLRLINTAAALMEGRAGDAAAVMAEIDSTYRTGSATESADTEMLRGWLHWERGEMALAAERLEFVLGLLDGAALEPGLTARPYFLPLLVDALLRSGQGERATQTLRQVVARECHPDMNRLDRAGLAAAEMRVHPSPKALRAALDACATADWPWLAGLSSWWAGELLGDRPAARAARDTWRQVRYASGMERADRLLATLERSAATAGRLLTAREETVAELIAEGLTNAQIAERLSISPVTVAHHVSSVLDKLGVASRTQVAVMVARGDAAP